MNHEKRARNKGIKEAWMVLCLTALAVSCLIYACFEPIGMETGNSTFSITIGGGGRTILSWDKDTNSADLLHAITLTGGPGPGIERKGIKAGQTVQFAVAPGHWDITVKAYLGDVLKAEGFTSVNLKRGHNGAVPITMKQPAVMEPPQKKETYSIKIDISGNDTGDIVTASPDSGIEGNTVTLAYTVANTAYYNLLDFYGVTIESVGKAESGTRTYTINKEVASDGVITIIAVFTHTNLKIDPIAFTDTSVHITKTYGEEPFTNAITSAHNGNGAITYSSSNETVAKVESSSGLVTILKAGSTTIKAEKADDPTYAYAQANYTLAVNPKSVTITGLLAANKVYDGTTTATVNGTAVISGKVGSSDDVTVKAGTAAFESKTVGNGKTVTFSGYSLTGADTGNYSLSGQPGNVTASITAKSVTITGLSVANKQYDGTTTATVTGTATINGKISGDTVTVKEGIATFADATIGNGKTVTFKDWSLIGTDAGNYSLSAQPSTAMANIEYVSMVQISAGTFTMGSPTSEANRGNTETQHSVTLSAFYMGKYQVTQALYELVMGTNPSYFHGGSGREPAAGEIQGKRPVEYVTWYKAVEFCNKLSALDGRTAVYTTTNGTVTMDSSKNGYRLPTEAQWEYACRAGTTTAYNTGAAISDNTGWYTDNSGGKTHQVGLKPANAWGLYDMHGNVREWCWDLYDSYSSSSVTDPTGAVTGSNRVIRGGYWGSDGQYLRSACRSYGTPDYLSDGNGGLGFRVVRP
jgi:formylglycine-generating enzyme required for sulfatase activity